MKTGKILPMLFCSMVALWFLPSEGRAIIFGKGLSEFTLYCTEKCKSVCSDGPECQKKEAECLSTCSEEECRKLCLGTREYCATSCKSK